MTQETIPNSALFKNVPAGADTRRSLWLEALNAAGRMPRRRPLSQLELLAAARCLLSSLRLGDDCLGYAMVMLNNAFWVDQYLSVPFERRLLLLPRCLGDLQGVMASAREHGYRVCVADGSPVVVKIIGEEQMDAVLGIGCMDSLEKAFEKVRQVGLPAIAVPLTRDGCVDTEADGDLVRLFLESSGPQAAQTTRNYLPLMRAVQRLFEPAELDRVLSVAPRREDPTAEIAVEWLRRGGKRLRPFVTLASFRAFADGREIPDSVRCAAVAVEAFHKASLVHDDIEDDEDTRYGVETVHRRHGTAVAINVGDYLVGLGYRLAVEAAPDGALLRMLSEAHLLLTLGQGSELLWPEHRARGLAVAEALRCYTLKTSPAFEAAILSGMILAGASAECLDTARNFCKHLGAAFQVQNDLAGWEQDADHGRPTVLLSLALESCTGDEARALLRPCGAQEAGAIYARHDVLARARLLAERLKRHAVDLARGERNERFGDLLWFLADTILK